ncbi:MAG: 2-phosphosulfolactate phosphatase [Proteobacteria bacterium]|nr:2-phosphosulfolactate phosphatase [Pseudomonadota bacterium]
MSKIHVLLKKEELDNERLTDKVVVVLDILFATSSIVAALAHGAGEVIPTLDGTAAQAEAKRHAAGSFLLSGELNAETLPGFVHPTPLALLQEDIAGRTLIYSTTNGTVALKKCRGAAHIYAAALLNGEAVVRHIVRNHPDSTVLVVCSGSVDNFNLEDFYGAGYLISLFRNSGGAPEFSDAALAAEMLHAHGDAAGCLMQSRVGRLMLARNLTADVHFAALKSVFDSVPQLAPDGSLRLL